MSTISLGLRYTRECSLWSESLFIMTEYLFVLWFPPTSSIQSEAMTLLLGAAMRMMNAQRPVYSAEYRYCLDKVKQRI